ncbi:hypothetical protein ACG7TL_002990 [Trametes sanguinea]
MVSSHEPESVAGVADRFVGRINVLLLSPDARTADPGSTVHLYMYARVIKVLHVNTRLVDAPNHEFERMDILWVRWFELDPSFVGGFEAKRLHRLRFVPIDAPDDSFGFIDPCDVIRGTHLIPAFAHGSTDELLPGRTIARQNTPFDQDDGDIDFRYHYVNIFADRDMFMRYYGGGIGHRGLQTPSQFSYANTNGNDDDDDDDELTAQAASSIITPPSCNKSAVPSQSRTDAPMETEAHCEEDVLRLVPELRQRLRGVTFNSGYHDENIEEEEEELAGQDENDSEDEELIASADLPVDGVNNHDNTDVLEAGGSDEEDDDYGFEDYAPL